MTLPSGQGVGKRVFQLFAQLTNKSMALEEQGRGIVKHK